jgi:hypothetical protein
MLMPALNLKFKCCKTLKNIVAENPVPFFEGFFASVCNSLRCLPQREYEIKCIHYPSIKLSKMRKTGSKVFYDLEA